MYVTPDLTRKQQQVDNDLRPKVKHNIKNEEPSPRIKSGKVVKNGKQRGVVILYEPMK